MNEGRTIKVIRNTAYSFVYQLSDIVLSFILRTIFIRTLGKSYLGISGLFANILTVLSLMDLGVGSAIVFALYKICTQLSKKYETNKVLLLTLILTFISLPMLATFIYGDIPSLALCLFAVYFMMRYTETKEIKYPII